MIGNIENNVLYHKVVVEKYIQTNPTETLNQLENFQAYVKQSTQLLEKSIKILYQ